jgi:hypothetical protein
MEKRKKWISVAAVAAAATFAPTATVSANAAVSATYTAACSVTGVKGALTFSNWTTTYVDIDGWVSDNAETVTT